jgi:hypothetical protein
MSNSGGSGELISFQDTRSNHVRCCYVGLRIEMAGFYRFTAADVIESSRITLSAPVLRAKDLLTGDIYTRSARTNSSLE